jgi:hypothetical protein
MYPRRGFLKWYKFCQWLSLVFVIVYGATVAHLLNICCAIFLLIFSVERFAIPYFCKVCVRHFFVCITKLVLLGRRTNSFCHLFGLNLLKYITLVLKSIWHKTCSRNHMGSRLNTCVFLDSRRFGCFTRMTVLQQKMKV